MVAQSKKGQVLDAFIHVFTMKTGENMFEFVCPNPFDFVSFVVEFRYIVKFVTRLDEWFEIFFRLEFPGVDDHGPLLSDKGFFTFFRGGPGGRR